MKPMRLIYIYHSGFIIESKEFAILIDYYRDTPEFYVHRHFLKRPGRLYILSSHAHPDHFNPEILSWKPERPDIRYILSEDIRDSQKACFHDAIFLKKGEEWNDDLLKIKAFGSTDIGISFLLDVADKRIFHAGDLNNWHWSEESTPQEICKAEGDFLAEIKNLQQKAPRVDIAMFPVDSRIGKDYMRGAEQFVERIKTAIFAPMHFGEDYRGGNAFRTFAESRGCRFLTISRRGESFDITK